MFKQTGNTVWRVCVAEGVWEERGCNGGQGDRKTTGEAGDAG